MWVRLPPRAFRKNMERIHIKEVAQHPGQQVKIAGFVQTIRDQSKIAFLIIRDSSGTVQTVITKDQAEALATVKELTLESVVEIVGTAKEEKQAPGGYEVAVESLIILSRAEPELPIPILEKGSQEEAERQKRLDWRWLDLRKPEKLLIFKVWTLMEQAFREYWTQHDYVEIHSPKLIGAPSESGAEVFEVKYFERRAYLAQSPQFYKQMGMAAGFEKIFEVGPVFRAEPSYTSRHATEFTGYDTELSYIESHHTVMDEEAKTINYVLEKVNEKYGGEIKKYFDREVVVPSLSFPKLTMAEAKKILGDLGVPSEKVGDLSPEEERKICEYVKKEQGHEFVFIVDYPISVRPFYHMRHEDNPQLTKSFDLLWNGLEVTTGAQREHRYEVLIAQAKEKGLNTEPIQFYLNFFKYGCPPHGGYGMGPNRMLMQLLGLENVREASFLYRGVKRLEP